MPRGRKRQAPDDSIPLQSRQTRARTRTNQFVNPGRGRVASNVGNRRSNMSNQFVNPNVSSSSSSAAATSSSTSQGVASRHRVFINNTSNRSRRGRGASNVSNRGPPRSSSSVQDQHPSQSQNAEIGQEIQHVGLVNNDAPGANFQQQDQQQQIDPVNRMVNANQLLHGEHGESNITSVAYNVSEIIPNVNDNLVSTANISVSGTNASSNNFTSSGTSNTNTFSHNSGLNIASTTSSGTYVQNINTNGPNSGINALQSSGSSLGLINSFGTSGTYVSNTSTNSFNLGNNAFGLSGSSLPFNNSSNTNSGVNILGLNTANSSFPISSQNTLGVSIPSSSFYVSRPSVLANSITNNPISSVANLFASIPS